MIKKYNFKSNFFFSVFTSLIFFSLFITPVIASESVNNSNENSSTSEAENKFDARAKLLLKEAAVTQEAYYVDNFSYITDEDVLVEKLKEHWKHDREGLNIFLTSDTKEHYEMEAFHDNGTRIYTLKGPGGMIKSIPDEH